MRQPKKKAEILQLLSQRPDNKALSITEIARQVGVSPPYVHAVLKKAKDETPQFFKHSNYYKF